MESPKKNMKEKIAVVDDDKMSLKLVKRVFDKAGIDGRYLCTGDEFYAFLEEEGSVGDMWDEVITDFH